MFSRFRRHISSLCGPVTMTVTQVIDLQLEEYPQGVFRIFRHQQGDLNLLVDFKGPSSYHWHCEQCNDTHDRGWNDVCWYEMEGCFRAPSRERLVEALAYADIGILGD